MNPRAPVLASAFLMVACTPTSRAIVGQTVESVKAGENAKARLALQAPCAITVGAKNRVLSDAEKAHVEGLCGGQSE